MKRYQKMSRLYAPTLKEDPAEAELVSHKLLLRAGMIRKTAAGLYSYLPLAWRVISKVEDVIRDEMEGIGAQEMMAPIVTPAELWEQSHRLGAYGPELMRLKDRHERDFVLGPHPRGDLHRPLSATSYAATSSCPSRSTRSRTSSATRGAPASVSCAAASSS